MMEIYAQGDLLIERVEDVEPSGTIILPDPLGAWCWRRASCRATVMSYPSR